MLGQAIIDDLTTEQEFFEEVAGLTQGPVITTLRALDIVAWHAGRTHIGPAIWAAATPAEQPELDGESDLPSIDLDDEHP